MTWEKAISTIESHEFAARLNLSNDLRTFLRAAAQEDAVGVLLHVLDSPERRAELLRRLLDHAGLTVDPRYRNPADVALAVYLSLLRQKDPELARLALDLVTQTPNCWWAGQVATAIRRVQEAPNAAGSRRHDVAFARARFSDDQGDEAGDGLILGNLLRDGARTRRARSLTAAAIDCQSDAPASPPLRVGSVLFDTSNTGAGAAVV